MITARRMTCVNIGIFLIMTFTVIPVYSATYFEWKLYPDRNETLLEAMYTDNAAEVQAVAFTTSIIIMSLAFLIIIICMAFIIISLRNHSERWKTTQTQEKSLQKTSYFGYIQETNKTRQDHCCNLRYLSYLLHANGVFHGGTCPSAGTENHGQIR